jgi:hypothetical protein
MSERMAWFKFNPADYESDLDLLGCSLAAQGLWMRLLCLMHRSEPYGHLVQQGRACSARQIATLVRKTEAQIIPLLRELEAAAVFDRNESGVIFSRRMVRDFQARERQSQFGKQGGNPSLVLTGKAKQKQRAKGGLKAPLKGGVKGGLKAREEKKREEKKEPDTDVSVVDADAPTLPSPSSSVVAFPKRDAADEQAAFDAWNELALSSRTIGARSLDPDRRAKLRARLAECGGLAGWMVAIDKVRASSLWQGMVGTGWVGGFDDVLSKTKFRKLMEGGYDDRPAPARETNSERIRREYAERLARQGENDRTIDVTAS